MKQDTELKQEEKKDFQLKDQFFQLEEENQEEEIKASK